MDDRTRARKFERPEYIPVAVGLLPATWMRYREDLTELVARHPIIFGEQAGDRDYDAVGGTYVEGNHVDAWGCVWSNVHMGCEAIVTGHPIPTRASIRSYQPPAPGAGLPHGFMWLRLGDLRGFEELMVDFAEEPEELQMLVDMVREYNMGELRRMRAGWQPDGLVGFGDDLGMQTSLAISARQWRRYLKPCYKEFYGFVHEAGCDVFMHTDGHILPIIPDLIECGVNVINPQIRANGLDGLVRTCKGKVCVNLDLDRQMFPFASPAEIDAHIKECVEAMGDREGGLWLIAECGDDVPLANIEAICVALENYRGMFRN